LKQACYVILSGKYPWNIKNQNEQKLYSQIKRGLINYDPLISSSAKSCIEQMLRVDPAKRITAGEVIIHSWLTGVEKPEPKTAVDMLKEMAEERMSISKNTD